mmetsp:Transcript_11405/g.33609  ORF Transcript_11405/g.33609 Transcript_11405/m.33609 type:complete len:226 (+) Transcript_11405:1048-1725(+)
MCPRLSSRTCATMPASIAMVPFPMDVSEYVRASHASGKPRWRCSVVIQDSKAEKSRFVEIPPSTRPSRSSWKLVECSRTLMTISRTQYATQDFFRPNLSTKLPRKGANIAPERNPVRNSADMFTPYDKYSVYMCVPCIQSASMITKYTAMYSLRKELNSSCKAFRLFLSPLVASSFLPSPLRFFSSSGVNRREIKNTNARRPDIIKSRWIALCPQTATPRVNCRI